MNSRPHYKSPFKSYVQVNTPQEKSDELMFNETTRKMMSGRWRVWTVALARLNNYGHAPFRPGELAHIVCGKDTPSNRTMVARWVRDLGDMGWVAPSGHVPNGSMASTTLCILVHRQMANRGTGKATDFTCSEPAHMDCRRQDWPLADAQSHAEASSDAGTADREPATPEAVSEPSEYVAHTPEQPEIDPWADDGEGANLGRLIRNKRRNRV